MNRVVDPCEIAAGKAESGDGDSEAVIRMDEFGPLNLMPTPNTNVRRPAVGARQDPQTQERFPDRRLYLLLASDRRTHRHR